MILVTLKSSASRREKRCTRAERGVGPVTDGGTATMGTPHHQWRFGAFCLDTATMHLWENATPVALPPKAFDVLHYLVTHRNRLVTTEEWLEALWPATAVTDAVVRVAIGAVQQALGETAQTSRYIATVSRRGYRFLAPVTRGDAPAPPPPAVSLRLAAPGAPLPDALLPQTDIPAVVPAPTSPAPSSAASRPSEVSHLAPILSLSGERKQVTVLVAAIPTPLALLRAQDAEVVQLLMDLALQAMRDAVQRYGGRVYQARETGLLALFGAPQAYEDHALRACYAALAM